MNANALGVMPRRIKSSQDRRVNHFNLLKLAGAGTAISSTLEFAIDQLLQRQTDEKPINRDLSLEVAVYPRDAVQDEQDARVIRSDTVGRLALGKSKAFLVANDPCIFQLAPDGRPVVLTAWPITGGKSTVSIATLFPRGRAGPCVEIFIIPMDYIVDQKASLQNHFAVRA